ncbi:hypothetical protein [Pseudonocardia acaciae]|uniref:hypothetical protein n=1 Tax=Pseudonocardia acaciae TaxID=551276 RepID=UPI00048EFC85|nr:hypothetical protein [Pseudonocardia acaciae]
MPSKRQIEQTVTLVARDDIPTLYGVTDRTARRWTETLKPAGAYVKDKKAVALYATADIAHQ